nr:hypothetical protein [uncultured bacterium]
MLKRFWTSQNDDGEDSCLRRNDGMKKRRAQETTIVLLSPAWR